VWVVRVVNVVVTVVEVGMVEVVVIVVVDGLVMVVVIVVVIVVDFTVVEVKVVPQAENPMWLASRVTPPFLASALPVIVVPVVTVMLVSARMFPLNFEFVPRVAEAPICQKTLHGLPPLVTATDDELAVVSILPIWKIQTAFGLPCALRVKVPVSWADDVKQ